MTDITALVALSRAYRKSWFPPGLSDVQRAEQAELMHITALRMRRPKGLTASEHEDRRAALLAAAEPDRNPDLLRRVAGAHRPAEFRSRTNPYQAEIARVLDTMQIRRAARARVELRAGLVAYERAEADRLAAALDQRVAVLVQRERAQALSAALERKRRLRPQGPIRVF